jgi:hypothetical protein
MQTYGLSFEELYGLTIKRFWFLVNQVDRIEANDRLNQLEVLASATSGETYKAARERYTQTVGQVYVWKPVAPAEITFDPNTIDPEFDRAGLRALKAKLSGGL